MTSCRPQAEENENDDSTGLLVRQISRLRALIATEHLRARYAQGVEYPLFDFAERVEEPDASTDFEIDQVEEPDPGQDQLEGKLQLAEEGDGTAELDR